MPCLKGNRADNQRQTTRSSSEPLESNGIKLARESGLPSLWRVKPGRKLVEAGAPQCSDAELLAILLGSGGPGFSALDTANALLDKYGTLSGLMNRRLDEIAQVRGVKAVRAIRLAAAYELCQRLLKEVARDA